MDEPKRGDVRESDGMVCWGYTWKDKDGNKRYQWLTPERFAEKTVIDKERLAKYMAENAEAIRVKQSEKYQKNSKNITKLRPRNIMRKIEEKRTMQTAVSAKGER